jgi:natural product biosynthesis luciferase-like monooxygenase protein
VLTHLFDQRIDELADRIRQYRLARQQHGWDRGRVTVTLHTFIGETLDEVRRYAQQPYCNYLRSNFKLLKNLALSRGLDADLSRISPSHLDEMLNHIFEKFLGDRSLLGTPETCFELLEQLAQRGVNEVACLVDFGPDPQQIRAHLPHLSELNFQAAKLLIE